MWRSCGVSFHDLHEVREAGDPKDLAVVLGQAEGADRTTVPARLGKKAHDEGDPSAVDVADLAEVEAHPSGPELGYPLVGRGQRLVGLGVEVAAETHPDLVWDLRHLGSEMSLIHRSAPCAPSSGLSSGSTRRWSRPSNPPCS